MKQRTLLSLLFAGLALSLAAQQTTNGFVAIDRSGGQQNFLLDHYPRLTFRTDEGIVSFEVRDTRNKAQTGVKTCVFGEVSEENCPPVETTDGATICPSELPYVWEGETFNQSGVRTKTLRTADGCDSTVTFTLTVNQVYQTADGATICPSELPYVWEDETFTQSGVRTKTLRTADGCDSTVTFTLTVNQVYQTADGATICPSELPYVWEDETFTQSGVRTKTLRTADGCDSTVTFTLTVNREYKTAAGATINASQLPYVWEGETFFNAGSKTKTLQSITGCDSTVTFTLTVLTEQQTTTGFVAIDRSGGMQKFRLGNYPRLTFQTANGVTSFHVQDTRNNTMAGVKTCVFIEVPEQCSIETTDGATVWDNQLPYTWEGIAFTTAGTETKTLQASDGCDSTVTFTLRVRYHNITLQENENADYYTQFAEDYNGRTVNTATLNRQFTQGKWATLCLPFNVNKAMMMALGLYNRVFEFRYVKQDASTINIYFATARSIEAGKGYIVNPNAKLAAKTSFVFPNVTINTDSDNGDITALTGYNDGTNRGNLFLVGTLRTGILQGSTSGNTYLGLKDNQLYYPNITIGTSIRAYRGFFRSDIPVNAQRVRIIAEGEPVIELEVVGTAPSDWSDKSDTPARKYIHNGVLYIERNGILYDAQGKRIKQTNQQ